MATLASNDYTCALATLLYIRPHNDNSQGATFSTEQMLNIIFNIPNGKPLTGLRAFSKNKRYVVKSNRILLGNSILKCIILENLE